MEIRKKDRKNKSAYNDAFELEIQKRKFVNKNPLCSKKSIQFQKGISYFYNIKILTQA